MALVNTSEQRPAPPGRSAVLLAGLARRRGGAILAFHGVQRMPQELDPELLCIDPDRFRMHLRLLRDAEFEFVTVADWVERAFSPEGARGLIALSFDDGLSNLHSVALPILREHSIPASVYVPTGLIGKAYPWALPESGLRIVDADEIRELSRSGIEIGAHTVNHRDLSRCSYEESLREMTESRATLQELTGTEVRTFAYPYARWSADAERAAADAGFSGAVSYSMLAGPGRYALSRELVTPQHGPGSLVAKVAGLYDPVAGSWPGTAARALSRPFRLRPKPPLRPRV